MGGRLPHRSICGPLGLGLFPKVFFAHLLRSEQLRLGLGSVEGAGVGVVPRFDPHPQVRKT